MSERAALPATQGADEAIARCPMSACIRVNMNGCGRLSANQAVLSRRLRKRPRPEQLRGTAGVALPAVFANE